MDCKKIYNKNYFNGENTFFYMFGYGRLAGLYLNNLFKQLKPYVQYIGSGKVLDVGCAYGFMLKRFPETFEKFGIDVSDWAIKKAEEEVPQANFESVDLDKKFYFSTEKFDIIICNDVIEHLKNPDFTLGNINKSLKSGGILYITTPNLNWVRKIFLKYADKKEHHISLFSHQSLFDLLTKNGFEVIDNWTYTNLIYFFFPKFHPKLAIESAFICRKL